MVSLTIRTWRATYQSCVIFRCCKLFVPEICQERLWTLARPASRDKDTRADMLSGNAPAAEHHILVCFEPFLPNLCHPVYSFHLVQSPPTHHGSVGRHMRKLVINLFRTLETIASIIQLLVLVPVSILDGSTGSIL